jgi:hypothetical protein
VGRKAPQSVRRYRQTAASLFAHTSFSQTEIPASIIKGNSASGYLTLVGQRKVHDSKSRAHFAWRSTFRNVGFDIQTLVSYTVSLFSRWAP